MIRHILITGERCLDSMLAINWATKQSLDIETVTYAEIPDVADIYGIDRAPSLLAFEGEGMVKRVSGFNVAKYNELLYGGIANE